MTPKIKLFFLTLNNYLKILKTTLLVIHTPMNIKVEVESTDTRQ